MAKYYVNIHDFQGGSWAMGCVETIKGWKERALEWCDSDENWELYKDIKKHKLDTDLLDIISDIWSIEIIEFNKENIEKILENYGKEEYYWMLYDFTDILEKR